MPPIPHDFRDPALLELAFRHASNNRGTDNERLEFLGDAVLDLIIADHLYTTHPELSEGDLTELKSFVVSRTSLAGSARALDLEARVQMGSGMRGRALPPSVLANLYEAVLGAVYLDAGFESARAFALATLAERLAASHASLGASNPKQELQRLAQAQTGSPPIYRVEDERGRSHARAFLVSAQIGGSARIGEREYPSAWGRTIKEAERWAAHEALLHYAREPYAREPYAREPYAREPYAREPGPKPPSSP